MRKLLHIIPRPTRVHDGVSSYARVLAASLQAAGGWHSEIVPLEGDPERFFRERAIGPVLLHYVGYGYQRRGCPRSLVESAVRWRKETDGPLLTVFHEVYASGPPWTSSFWLSPAQRSLARTLARGSDVCIASAPLYARILGAWIGRDKIACISVPSTVGEPQTVSRLADRAKRLAVFGSAGVRWRAYQAGPRLREVCSALSIQEVVDIGEPLPSSPRTQIPVPIRQLGLLPAEEVSTVLGGCLAGFVCYPPALLGKSTIFAAYCAHGLVPLWTWPGRGHAPPPGETVPGCDVSRHAPLASMEELQLLADAARAWYTDHSLTRQAGSIITILSRSPRA